MQPDSEERELVDAARREDRGAFKALYERYRDRVYNLAFYSLGEELWAEDVLQIVFLKIYRGLPAFRYEASLSTWIYRIAVNECQNQLQRRGAKHVPLDAILGSDEEFDTAKLPDTEHLERERRQILRDAVMDLSPKLRGVVVLKYVEGLSYDEIARVLECAPGTVASRLNRALAELETRLHPLRRIL
ncbi:MAG TPA: sigma-70 family RNA polymerase sigma factor [Blastocatellia bacterium]|nr:sigma-70 family RNA polymerase sigma factor [Blastocatellia bacterium]